MGCKSARTPGVVLGPPLNVWKWDKLKYDIAIIFNFSFGEREGLIFGELRGYRK